MGDSCTLNVKTNGVVKYFEDQVDKKNKKKGKKILRQNCNRVGSEGLK